MILVGLIPGPAEPKHDLNSFLKLMVADLLKLWEGMEFSVPSFQHKKTVRCMLACVACDIPAGQAISYLPT